MEKKTHNCRGGMIEMNKCFIRSFIIIFISAVLISNFYMASAIQKNEKIKPNKSNVGIENIGLDFKFIESIKNELSDVHYNVKWKNGLAKGREWGSEGEYLAAKIIIEKLYDIGFSSHMVEKELINGSEITQEQLPERYNYLKISAIDNKVEVNDFSMTAIFKNSTTESVQCYVVPSAVRCNRTYQFENLKLIPILRDGKIFSGNILNFFRMFRPHLWIVRDIDLAEFGEKYLEALGMNNPVAVVTILSALASSWYWCKGIIYYETYKEANFEKKYTYHMWIPMKDFNFNYPIISISSPYCPIFSVSGFTAEKLMQNYIDVVINYHLDQSYNTSLKSYNVIATINGSDNDKTIILGAHYDSYWGEFSGDNAGGVAILLGIAKYIKDNNIQPKYKLKFVAFTGEEYICRGSVFHDIRHQYENITHVLNLDQLGYYASPFSWNTTLEFFCNNADMIKIFWPIYYFSGYQGYCNEPFGPYVTDAGGASDDEPFRTRENIVTIALCKDTDWSYWHRYGTDGKGNPCGDIKTCIPYYYLAASSALAWNISKYIILNPDCKFEEANFVPKDRDNNQFFDTIEANISIETMIPHDKIMVRTYFINSSSEEVVSQTDDYYIITSKEKLNCIISQSLFANSPGEYYLKIELYNSTGLLNTLANVNVNAENFNDLIVSPTYYLFPFDG